LQTSRLNNDNQDSLALNDFVYVHIHRDGSHYRIGQILDQFDANNTSSMICIFRADPPSQQAADHMAPVGIVPQGNGLNCMQPGLPVAPLFPQFVPQPISQPITPTPRAAFVPGPPNTTTTVSTTDCGLNVVITKKIPKPANAWILYRRANHASEAAANPGLHTSDLCKQEVKQPSDHFHWFITAKIIADRWRNEPREVKRAWSAEAALEKAKHQMMYPNYRVSPRKSSEIKRRKAKKVSTVVLQKDLDSLPTVNDEKLLALMKQIEAGELIEDEDMDSWAR
jgi:hypothetical protein